MKNRKISSSNLLAKECIVSALHQLIHEKPLSAIHISELCKKAGVSRMTFYRNYESRESIFTKHLAELFDNYKIDEISQLKTGSYCDSIHIHHYFDFIYKHQEFIEGLIRCGFDVILFKTLNEYILSKWSKKGISMSLLPFLFLS